ncbi:MAG: hypothetical protein ACI4TM_05410, partial [Candidatus Cryptobacteroides sp.]
MMKLSKILHAIAVFFAVFPVLASAQDLPSLPADPAVSVTVLPNGISCYVVVNGAEKGKVDFALVQKAGYGYIP